MIWRVRLGRLPVRDTLDKMGIDLHSVLCPRCAKEVESLNHALFLCDEVNKLWREVARWWREDAANFGSLEDLLESSTNGEVTNHKPKLWKEVVWAFLYLIWSHRNRIIFKREQRKLSDLVLEFQRKSFEWIASRIHGKHLDWVTWLSDPERVLR